MSPRCGCYYTSAVEYGSKTHHLPQVKVHAHTIIQSTAYRTTLTQIFVNPPATHCVSECKYVFPLYDGVSVVGFTCDIGSRTIKGVVEEKAKARQTYDEAVSRGETAGLLEQRTTPDTFEILLGNIPVGVELTAKITYVGELKHDVGFGGIRYTLPTFVSPRYGSSRASVTAIDLSDAAKEGISIMVDVEMPAECPIKKVQSPSHPIAITLGSTSTTHTQDTQSPCQASATLSLGTAVMDKDFVLEILHKDLGKPRALLETHPDSPGQRALMTTLVPQTGLTTGENLPEIIIVADQSGSMSGRRTATLVSALHILLKSLPVGIKFNIIAFGSNHRLLWNYSRSYTENHLEQAMAFINGFNAGYGGTEMLRAMSAAIESRDAEKDLSIILATDGDIWQQNDFLSYLYHKVANSKTFIRVFPLGIGNSVSSSLIEGVARATNGFAQTVCEGEKQDSKIIRMLKGALTPSTGSWRMEVQYEKNAEDDEFVLVERVTDSLRMVAIDDDIEDVQADKPSEKQLGIEAPKLLQSPQVIPPLYFESRTTVYLLLSPSASHLQPKSVILRNDAEDNPFEISIPVEVLSDKATTVHSLAAKRAILELEEGRGWLHHVKDGSDRLLEVTRPKDFTKLVTAEAVRLGVQFQIAGKYTSFVAVESYSSDGSASTSQRSEDLEDSTKDAKRIASSNMNTPHMKQEVAGGFRELAALNHTKHEELVPFPAARYSNDRRMCAEPSSGTQGGAGGGRGGSRGIGPSNHALFSSPSSSPKPPSTDSQFYATGSVTMQTRSRGICATGGESKRTVTPPDSSDEDIGFGDLGNTPPPYSAAPMQHYARGGAPAKGNGSTDPLQRIVALQTFAGNWEAKDDLLDAIGVDGQKAQMPDGRGSEEIWATILAITFLEVVLAGRKEAWEMIVEKGKDWLRVKGVEEESELWVKARGLLMGKAEE